MFTVKPFGKVVICAATTGFDLDFDVRYLWMRQKEILGSHFANAYECNKANELIESGQIRPVLWRTLGFDGVPEAHQLMRENKHLGKISILVGADEEGQGKTADGPGRDPRGGGRMIRSVQIDWVANPFRGDKFAEGWLPAAQAVLDFGATEWAFYRALDGRLDFIQTALFPSKATASATGTPGADRRSAAIELQVPVLYGADASRRLWEIGWAPARRPSALLQRSHREPGVLQLLPVVLRGLARARSRRSPGPLLWIVFAIDMPAS